MRKRVKEMRPQKLIALPAEWLSTANGEHELNAATVDGYRFGGMVHRLDGKGGVCAYAGNGTYTKGWTIWLDPAESNSQFHLWRIWVRGHKDVMADFQTVLEYENRTGFNLAAICPDDAISLPGA